MLRMKVLSGALCLALLSGCISRDVSQALDKMDVDISDNQEFCNTLKDQEKQGFYVNADGFLRLVYCNDAHRLKKERCVVGDVGIGCPEAQGRFDKILANLESHRTNTCQGSKSCRIMVFAHGGLRSTSESVGLIEVLRTKALADGFFPIFINWRSSFSSTYLDHLRRIRQGETKGNSGSGLVYFLSDVARTIGNAPEAWVSEGNHALDSMTRKYKPIEPSDHLIVETDQTPYDASGTAAWWLLSPVKIFTTPMVYTLGKPPWDVMKNRTATMFHPSTENFTEIGEQASRQLLCSHAGIGCSHGVAGRFLVALAHYLKKQEKAANWDVTLIGHSMGGIVLNNALTSAPELQADRVVHMASADSIDNFFLKTAPYILNSDAEFYSLFLHPYREDRERTAWGLAPSGSLLAWIDNMFTTPQAITNRTAGRWDNMSRSLALMHPTLQEQTWFKIFGRRGEEKDDRSWECNIQSVKVCEPQTHGEFSSARFWCPEFYFDSARRKDNDDLPWCDE